jgi:hypothetical protein
VSLDLLLIRLFDAVEKHYGVKIEYTFPDAEEVITSLISHRLAHVVDAYN